MDEEKGYTFSWSGFTDYIRCFHEVKPLWILVGSVIFIGTIVSLLPQIIKIINLRSSYGISPVFAFMTSIAQFMTVLNYFCLHNADFYGIVQIPLSRTLPRLLTFFNVFALWYCYFFVVMLLLVFFNNIPRAERLTIKIKKEFKFSILIISSLYISTITLFLLYIISAAARGFSSSLVFNIGKVMGSLSSLISICQYMPQFITTCKIKDNGSLSLITLAIQAPGGTINALFMCFGQHEHWTTWLSTLISALQQFLLLFICIFFKIRNKIRGDGDSSFTQNDSEVHGYSELK